VSRPRIAVTPWRRRLPTYLGERTLLDTLDPAYTDRVADAGGLPLVVPRPPGPSAAAIADEVLDLADGLLVTGGGDVVPETYGAADAGSNSDMDAAADAWEIALLHSAAARRLPTLAICRGAQLLACAFGGALSQELPAEAEHRDPGNLTAEEILAERHPVELVEGSRLAALYGRSLTVNTIHHHGIADAGTLAVTARAAGGLIEGVEAPDWPVIGVQWHPEKMHEAEQRKLFERLIDDARGSRP
jgi:putative glutamine amidotransferase